MLFRRGKDGHGIVDNANHANPNGRQSGMKPVQWPDYAPGHSLIAYGARTGHYWPLKLVCTEYSGCPNCKYVTLLLTLLTFTTFTNHKHLFEFLLIILFWIVQNIVTQQHLIRNLDTDFPWHRSRLTEKFPEHLINLVYDKYTGKRQSWG